MMTSQRHHTSGASPMLVLGLVLALQPALGKAQWPSLFLLESGSDDEFLDLVRQLATMTRYSYTATWGSYYNPAEAERAPSGWQKSDLESNPPGTDLNLTSDGGKADICANYVMDNLTMPAYCGLFHGDTLDYLAHALQFAELARERYPSLEWLFTGHSLGAELATIVAASRRSKALVFSSPAVMEVISSRTSVSPEDISAWQIVSLYKEWDPLHWAAQEHLPGPSCVWLEAPAPGCEACKTVGPVMRGANFTDPNCRQCFSETHYLSFYLQELTDGRRPVCGNQTDIETQDDIHV